VPQIVSGLPVSIIKGQVIICERSELLPECSVVSKGYVAFLKQSHNCYVGSTYEREVVNEIPDLEFARRDLFPKIEKFFPAVHDLNIVECKAALRVMRRGHYFPILTKQQDRVWILTAMGSRGLLYHAMLGKVLARAVIENDARLLDRFV
jgi:glycine/D-amino acid oxidase-like deaminating enzyme